MDTLILEGVRCFGDRQELPIRPVTLLVGENSTGKSTVLAMVRAAWDIAVKRTEPDFNEEPFDLGGYDTMAYYHGGQGKRAHEFRIGATFRAPRFAHRIDSGQRTLFGTEPSTDLPATYKVMGSFVEHAGQPRLAAWEREAGDAKLSITSTLVASRVVMMRGTETLLDEAGPAQPTGAESLDSLAFMVIDRRRADRSRETKSREIEQLIFSFLRGYPTTRSEPRPIAGAPIRSKPIRTYDPKREVREPEGSHVPMELATLHGTSPEAFEALAKALATYGKDANLFSQLKVKRLGRKAGDPFQLLIFIDKFAFNLRDVGYGVSQVLPILVETMRAPKDQTFLLQQPEVHLHPRAQAALGSLLVAQAAQRRQTFVVETHSDYLVDRVRMDIRDGRGGLKPKDVVILYFERVAGKAQVHPITMDERGNLLHVPRGFRRFFLEEERRLLGIGS